MGEGLGRKKAPDGHPKNQSISSIFPAPVQHGVEPRSKTRARYRDIHRMRKVVLSLPLGSPRCTSHWRMLLGWVCATNLLVLVIRGRALYPGVAGLAAWTHTLVWPGVRERPATHQAATSLGLIGVQRFGLLRISLIHAASPHISEIEGKAPPELPNVCNAIQNGPDARWHEVRV